MSLRLVNGYVCRNCTDEDLAKKGIDPEHPKRGVAASEKASRMDKADAKATAGAVEQPADSVALGENRPATSGDLGRTLNVFA